MAWSDPIKHAHPHICYYAKFNRSMSKGVGINREEPQKFGSSGDPSPWDWEVAVPLRKCPFPTCVTMPNLFVLGQTVGA